MSRNPKNLPAPPKTERWLITMALAFVPVIIALFVPQAARIPLVGVGGLLFVVGFVQMVRQARVAGGNDNLRRLVASDPE